MRVALCYRIFMSQPVKLSDALVLDARIHGEAQQRSIAGQVEFWAKLGQTTEQLLDGRRIQRLRAQDGIESLSKAINEVEKPAGRLRLKAYLDSLPFPHFEQHPQRPDLLIRIEETGQRIVGRFVNKQFIEVDVEDN
jgi:hypothetical protein